MWFRVCFFSPHRPIRQKLKVARFSAELWTRLSGEPPKDGGAGGISAGGPSEDAEKRPLRFDEVRKRVCFKK